jgi:hypothetical protein
VSLRRQDRGAVSGISTRLCRFCSESASRIGRQAGMHRWSNGAPADRRVRRRRTVLLGSPDLSVCRPRHPTCAWRCGFPIEKGGHANLLLATTGAGRWGGFFLRLARRRATFYRRPFPYQAPPVRCLWPRPRPTTTAAISSSSVQVRGRRWSSFGRLSVLPAVNAATTLRPL